MKIGYAYLEHGMTGGIERASRDLAGAMAVRGHEVHYYCVRSTAQPPCNVAIHRVWAPGPTHAAQLASFALCAPRMLSRGGYAITHSHGTMIGADVVTAHSCHEAGLKRIQHNSMGVRERTKNFGIADQIRLYIERANFVGRRYKAVLAVSHGVRQELMEVYGVPRSDITVVPNGIDLLRFPQEEREYHRKAVREAHGLPHNAIILLFVGNEFHRKGLSVLIHALKLVNRRDVYVFVAGGDDAAPYVERAGVLGVADRVKFLGKVARVEPLYLAADQFLLPSSYEAFSVAMLEAAAAGLPLVLTPVSGTGEVLVDGTTGFSVQQEPGSLARAIQQIIGSESLGRLMGAAARHAAQRFSWDRIAEETAEVYSCICLQQKKVL